ncbi:flagellar biosynthesis protein FlgL [Phaeobacter gallaeciensis]|uniref:Flagellar biosynthesis protein FlgL n=2 Tax=Roseobacteraceae TaxID=2854170 RepID=A0A366WVE3_9RHOB|nr:MULTISPECIES: flagellin [Roseobacteraceae]MBT3143366.1 flagellar biosynthesis protein FlgL [Falsiruegeria litorea]MBT8169810.1 flagellar biosynthesis protein FlgL [Falsiruegeria litorea]RBW54402.1 flagellar biosynthesis protein FlgL [Phaeobacter gallaeciensis]
MSMNSIGDLAQSLTLRARSVLIKNEIETLTQEMSTGETSNITQRLAGDYSHLSDIDRNLSRIEGFSVTTAETGLLFTTAQNHLETLHTRTDELANALTAVGSFGQTVNREQVSKQAQGDLITMVASLNGAVGGRSLFAGVATDTIALNSGDTLLADLKAAIIGQTTAADVLQAAESWFNDPAGFKSSMYRGSDQTLAAFEIAEGEEVSLKLKADDPAFRDMLKSTALASLATDSAVGLSPQEQAELLKQLGGQLASSRDALVGVRADVGFSEARVEQVETRNSASKTSLEYARRELLEADPFETATRLKAVQFQLESLYAVTVRTSQLSLVNFLR